MRKEFGKSYIYIYKTESLCCTSETNITLSTVLQYLAKLIQLCKV